MEGIQRTKILEAIAAIVAERGVSEVKLTEVIARSGVSRRVFYELFADRDACLLAAFDLGVERATERMAPAYATQRRWRDAIRAGLAEGLRFLDEEPAFGRLCIVHSQGGGTELMRRRARTQAQLWEVVDRGRHEGADSRGGGPPAIVAEGVVGAVLAVIQTRLLAQDAEPPDERPAIELFGSLMSLILLPYLGASAARRELTRPAPLPRRRAGAPSVGAPGVEALGVRLTYRTGRVLTAIGAYPGASNREVAERAGIVDQGQISKLLARLQEVGAIENVTEGTSRGAPNAWRLTELGAHVERGIEERFGRESGGGPAAGRPSGAPRDGGRRPRGR